VHITKCSGVPRPAILREPGEAPNRQARGLTGEDLLERSPAAHVRRSRLDCESHATGLDRNELGALLVAAGLGPPGEHALISVLALSGLRSAKAPAPTSRARGAGRGHRALALTRKGGKVVTMFAIAGCGVISNSA
jgi:hypothetical protein